MSEAFLFILKVVVLFFVLLVIGIVIVSETIIWRTNETWSEFISKIGSRVLLFVVGTLIICFILWLIW